MKSIPFFFMLLISLIFMGLAQAGPGFYCEPEELSPHSISRSHPQIYQNHGDSIRAHYETVQHHRQLVRLYPRRADGYHEGFEAAVKNYKQFLTSIGVISRR